MYIDLDIEEEIVNAVNDYLAGGGDLVTWAEHERLLIRVNELEEKLKNLDFWKADRNHSHK
jgi:hypothetical protein